MSVEENNNNIFFWVDGYYPLKDNVIFDIDKPYNPKDVAVTSVVCKSNNKKNAAILAVREFKKQLTSSQFNKIQIVIYENNTKHAYIRETREYYEFYYKNELINVLKKFDDEEMQLCN